MNRTKNVVAAIFGLAMLALPLTALAGHDHDADDYDYGRPNQPHDNGWHKGWYKHHRHEMEPAPAGYHRVCDADGDDCRVVPNGPPTYRPSWEHNYVCDADGDDCHWANNWAPNYWRNNGGYNYGAPYSWYQAQAPGTYSLVQQRDWLIARRHRAMEVLARMRARGDRGASDRMLGVVNDLNARIKGIDRRLAGR